MDLYCYLKTLKVSEDDIQRLKDEKIDADVIAIMPDEELAWFLKSAGDRILVRNFVKTQITSEERKEHLIKNVRSRLAALRSKRIVEKPSQRSSKNKSSTGEGPNTKSTRQLFLGWKHKEDCRITQVIEKKGGGTKLLSMPKDYKKNGIIELGKKLYFPNGISSKGSETKFSFELIDSSNKLVDSNKTVLEILEENSPKIPRIYLRTERIEGSENISIEPSIEPVVEMETSVFTEDSMTKTTEEHNEQAVTVYYADICTSKYSGETSVSFIDKSDVYEKICSLQGPPDAAYEHFDPTDFNYQIARIEENGVVTCSVESEVLDQVHRPSTSVISSVTGTSVISSVTASAKDEFSILSDTLLPIVDRKDIKFSEKILGAGSQGIVREASWLGTQVAVKSFKTGKLTDIELREIKLLASIRHPHIIQIMGICLENRQSHIIFELVKGDNLGDILFDEEKKKRYNLDNQSKNKLLLQVCQAVNYLHGQMNPVIHQDIKPDNVLVSENFVVKLCDLGLAKLKNMATQYRTVVGSIKGTVAYMAPEIILFKGTATIYSDIWSLGCTVYETFSEEDVWPDLLGDFTEALKEKMVNLECPNIKILPPHLQPIVQRCFNYTPEQRPSISELIDFFNGEKEG